MSKHQDVDEIREAVAEDIDAALDSADLTTGVEEIVIDAGRLAEVLRMDEGATLDDLEEELYDLADEYGFEIDFQYVIRRAEIVEADEVDEDEDHEDDGACPHCGSDLTA